MKNILEKQTEKIAQDNLTAWLRTQTNERDDVALTRTCSICGTVFMRWGHNASPINNGRCCDECNATVVIPKRIPPTNQRILKNLRSAGVSLGIPLDDLTDERLEQRIAARKEWTNGVVRDVIAKRVARMRD